MNGVRPRLAGIVPCAAGPSTIACTEAGSEALRNRLGRRACRRRPGFYGCVLYARVLNAPFTVLPISANFVLSDTT